MKIEDVIQSQGYHVSTTAGFSMWPMLRDRRDTVVVSAAKGKLHKYDVLLYRREDGYVLHRIVEVRDDVYVVCGDNCIELEYIKEEQVLGVLTEFYRGEKKVRMDSAAYQIYVRVWCFCYPLRRFIKRIKGRGIKQWKKR